MLILLLSLVVIGAALLTTSMARAWNRRVRERWTGFEADLLASTGLSVRYVDAGSFALAGAVGGRKVEVRTETVELPAVPDPDSSGTRVVTLVVPDAGPDLVACRRSHADRVFGPLPQAERIPTGHAAFDATFEVRGAPLDLHPALLDALRELDLHFLRRKDGALSIHLMRTEAKHAATWFDVMEALALREGASYRGGTKPTFRPAFDDPPPMPKDAAMPLWAAWGACLLTVPLLGMLLLGIFTPVRNAFFSISGCKVPGDLKAGSVNESFTIFCPDGSEASGMVLVGGLLLAAALTLSVGSFFSLRRMMARSTPS